MDDERLSWSPPSASCEFPSGGDVPAELEVEEDCADVPPLRKLRQPRCVKSHFCRAEADSASLGSSFVSTDVSLPWVEEEEGGEEAEAIGTKWIAVRPDTSKTHLEGGSERTGGMEGGLV